jgi:ubiquinone/menaquinone biosynthesis C-methylase UbiE
MADQNLPEHVQINRSYWDGMAEEWVAAGERHFLQTEPTWGMWGLPEAELKLLPSDMSGMQAIELGCGTAYVSSWLARLGARVVGIDNSEQQLETAQRLVRQHALDITLLHGNAEQVPYPDQSFDFAISEYGAAIWCDPYAWIPEAHRLLKPGGQLVFLGTAPLAVVCMPLSGAACEPTLHRPYFGLHSTDWRKVEIDPGGVEFNLTISEWLRLFRNTGFEVLDYHELQAPEGAPDRFAIPGSWAQHWPSEQVWKLRRLP